MASLSLKNIYKKYDNGFCAVTDFNLEVADKEFVVFVGPSGCGKSTTLRMIAGLEDITEGEFYIGDRLVNDVEPKDRDIALLDRKPKALSGGQRQRVALGRAIVRSPKVFLMDEPLSNLDAKLRSNMRAEIIKIHNTLGATTIYVTHDQTEAMTMADRIVVMKKGVVQQVGSPKDIYDHPENLFVAGFIGAPTMNFMRGKVVEGNFVTKDGGNIEIPVGYYEKLKELGYEGKEVVLGIRPENISNDPLVLETYSHAKITSKVIVAELLGSEYIVHTDLNGENIKAIVHSRQNIKMGDELTFALDMNRAHFFDVDTELSILD